LDKIRKKVDDFPNQFKKLHDEDFEKQKPFVKNIAKKLQVLIKGHYDPVLFEFRTRLNVVKVNESMIGFFIYKKIEKNAKKRNNIPWYPEFYFKMLPKKLCSINFESSEDFKEFYSRYNKERPWEFINPESKKKFPDAMNFILTHYYRRVN